LRNLSAFLQRKKRKKGTISVGLWNNAYIHIRGNFLSNFSRNDATIPTAIPNIFWLHCCLDTKHRGRSVPCVATPSWDKLQRRITPCISTFIFAWIHLNSNFESVFLTSWAPADKGNIFPCKATTNTFIY
jgi:hypothetical protein